MYIQKHKKEQKMKVIEITANRRYICEFKFGIINIPEEEYKAYQRRKALRTIKKNYKDEIETKEQLNKLVEMELRLLEDKEEKGTTSSGSKSGSTSSSSTGSKLKSFLNPHKRYTNYHKIR